MNEPSFVELYDLYDNWEDVTGQFETVPMLQTNNEVWDAQKYLTAMTIATNARIASVTKAMEERNYMDYVLDTGNEIIIKNWLFPRQEPIFAVRYDALKIPAAVAITRIQEAAELWVAKLYETNFKEHIGNYKLRKKATKEILTLALPDVVIDTLIKYADTRIIEFENSLKYGKDELAAHMMHGNIQSMSGSIYHLSENASIRLMCKEYKEGLVAIKEGSQKSLYVIESQRVHSAINGALGTLGRKKLGKGKTIADQYKLLNLTAHNGVSEVIEQEYNKFASYYRNHMVTSRATVELKRLVVIEKPMEKVVDLLTMYPLLNSELDQLMHNFSDYFHRGTEAGGDQNYIQINNFDAVYRSFHMLKTRLIFSGLNEQKAVDYIIEHGFKSSKRNRRSDLYNANHTYLVSRCQITNELMPSIFLTRVKTLKNELLNVSQYYIHFVANSIIRKYNWDAVSMGYGTKQELMWFEVSLRDVDYFKQTKLNHEYNVLTYLSPKHMEHENIEVFSAGKIYEEVPFIGVELEIERNESGCKETITEDVYDTLGRDFVIIKHDGSLQGYNPFEIVSTPATLSYQKHAWTKFMNDTATKSQLMSYTTGRCGMHVHISKGAFTGLHLAKFMQFINKTDNRNFITRLAGRDSNTYNVFTDYANQRNIDGTPKIANPKLAGLSHASKLIHGGYNKHYDAVSTSSKHNTVEVRIFRGNLATSHFFKNMEFVHSLWAYTKQCSMMQLDYKDFILWLFKENSKLYNNLQAWLMASGFAVSNRNTDNKATKEDIKKVQLVVSRKFTPKGSILKRTGKDKGLTKDELLANA